MSEFKNSVDAGDALAILIAYTYVEVKTINMCLNGICFRKQVNQNEYF